ncbi:hypothetical protein MVEN_02578600 [Mycena venus]|uniref:Uncharacterized protein n=1 Tax=Mycena venus TaxID=2733690 RepID=A0A8H6TWS1_9AGAR|nr:hypothetical protein MVEN_02578600 [Mycena venus]
MNLVILDDQSSQITKTGLWTGGGTTNHYDHTASASRAAGATMTFSFTGTSVWISKAHSSLYGATPVIFSTPYQSSISFNQPLFQSPNLAQGKHSLVATSQSGTIPREVPPSNYIPSHPVTYPPYAFLP